MIRSVLVDKLLVGPSGDLAQLGLSKVGCNPAVNVAVSVLRVSACVRHLVGISPVEEVVGKSWIMAGEVISVLCLLHLSCPSLCLALAAEALLALIVTLTLAIIPTNTCAPSFCPLVVNGHDFPFLLCQASPKWGCPFEGLNFELLPIAPCPLVGTPKYLMQASPKWRGFLFATKVLLRFCPAST